MLVRLLVRMMLVIAICRRKNVKKLLILQASYKQLLNLTYIVSLYFCGSKNQQKIKLLLMILTTGVNFSNILHNAQMCDSRFWAPAVILVSHSVSPTKLRSTLSIQTNRKQTMMILTPGTQPFIRNLYRLKKNACKSFYLIMNFIISYSIILFVNILQIVLPD